MAPFQLREHRKKTNLRAELRLVDIETSIASTEHIMATAINISKGGACLRLPKVFLNNIHIFFSTLNRKTHLLEITCVADGQQITEEISCKAQSIWMDSCDSDTSEPQEFLMGVQFLQRQKELYKILK